MITVCVIPVSKTLILYSFRMIINPSLGTLFSTSATLKNRHSHNSFDKVYKSMLNFLHTSACKAGNFYHVAMLNFKRKFRKIFSQQNLKVYTSNIGMCSDPRVHRLYSFGMQTQERIPTWGTARVMLTHTCLLSWITEKFWSLLLVSLQRRNVTLF